jgi:hypothetical protein
VSADAATGTVMMAIALIAASLFPVVACSVLRSACTGFDHDGAGRVRGEPQAGDSPGGTYVRRAFTRSCNFC